MKQLLKNISPFNNRAEMSTLLFVVKKILAFWLCYIAGLFIAEGVVILIHFAFGKNMLIGDVFDEQTITLIMYYGYIVMAGVAFLYWKLKSKKVGGLPPTAVNRLFLLDNLTAFKRPF